MRSRCVCPLEMLFYTHNTLPNTPPTHPLNFPLTVQCILIERDQLQLAKEEALEAYEVT